MKYIFIMLLFIVSVSMTIAQPSNNAIFKGGANDGFDKATFTQAGNNIFTGGTNDGWTYAGFRQASVNIYNGGTGDGSAITTYLQLGSGIFNGGQGDGWSRAGFLQAGNAIFMGGKGDGWANNNFLQPGNNIFNGNTGDGWSSNNYLQAGNSIFNGGIGDGWASTYRVTGPLPVRFLYFTATKQGPTTALLNWKTAEEVNALRYDVERSTDAVNFSAIGKVAAAGNSTIEMSYSYPDNAPAKGLNYYRLKQVDKDGHFIYTPARVVKFDGLDAGKVKYYPNPTHGLLNIALAAGMEKEVKLITISNALGMVLDQQRLPPDNNMVVPVNFTKYPKGTYFIQIQTPGSNSTQRIVLQ